MGRLIAASAPTRIDFAGGTLDIPPLYLFHEPAMTINVAIDLPAEVEVRRRAGREIRLHSIDQRRRLDWPSRDKITWTRHPFLELAARLIKTLAPPDVGLEMTTRCLAPAGAGVGGSSALAVAAVAALTTAAGARWGRTTLIQVARNIETQAIRVPTGYQDYYAAAYGGASAIEFGLGGIRRTSIASKGFLADLERHLLLLYVGAPRFSGANNWELFKQHIDGDKRVVRLFEALRQNAVSMRDAFLRRDISGIAELLNRDWQTRRRALPAMTTPAIDRLVGALRQEGALGARVCGAGGGGCLAMLIKPEARARLTALAESFAAKVLPCAIDTRGVVVRRTEG